LSEVSEKGKKQVPVCANEGVPGGCLGSGNRVCGNYLSLEISAVPGLDGFGSQFLISPQRCRLTGKVLSDNCLSGGGPASPRKRRGFLGGS